MVASVLLVLSGVAPYDRTTWWLEIFPVLLAAPVLIERACSAGTRSGTCFMAFVGAVTAQLLLARVHDRQLARLAESAPEAVRATHDR